MIETGNFNSFDGTKLFYRASNAKKGAIPVVLTHGFAEHSGRYSEIMQELMSHGYAPFAFDLRGHGRSDGKRGYINNFSDYVQDLKAAVETARERYKADKVILLAHSMGGLIAPNYAVLEPDRVLGLVLSSPLVGINVEVKGWKKALGLLMSKCWPSFAMANQIDSNLLTHDKAKAQAYSADPLIFQHVRAKWFVEILKTTANSVEVSRRLQHPFLLQVADDDHIVSYPKSCEWYEANTSPDKNLIVYKGFFHEIFNEVERAKPISDFLSFMIERWPNEKPHPTVENSNRDNGHI